MDNQNQITENPMVLSPVANPPILMIQLSVDQLKNLIAEGVQQYVETLELEEDEAFITPKKAARLLDVSTRTLDNYRELKKYKRPSAGTIARYKKTEVLAFLHKVDMFGRLIKE